MKKRSRFIEIKNYLIAIKKINTIEYIAKELELVITFTNGDTESYEKISQYDYNEIKAELKK